jgi:hypothetical protein
MLSSEDRPARLEFTPPPSVPWSPKDVLWGIISTVGLIILLVLVNGLLDYWNLALDPSLTVNLGTLLLLIPVWYFTIFKYGCRWSDLGLRPFSLPMLGTGCSLMFLFFLFNAVYSAILATFGQQIQPDIAPIFEDSTFPLALFFGGAVVAPLIEEIFFRGFVFAGLRQQWDWRAAALTSAGLFALAHILPTSLLPIFLLGGLFAFLYQFSGSIWPAILMHALTNTLALSVAYAMSQGWVPLS